jgi:hypothetical protein
VLDTSSFGQASSAIALSAFAWNGTTLLDERVYAVPNGSYVLVLSVLKPLGDENDRAAWETWTSPSFDLDHP